jgi:hypothetical protein
MIVTIPTTQKNSIKTHFKNQNIEANYPKKKKNKEFEFEFVGLPMMRRTLVGP